MTEPGLLAPLAAAHHLGIGLKKLRRLGLPHEGPSTRKMYRISVLDDYRETHGTEEEQRRNRASDIFTVHRRWTDDDGVSRPASQHPLYWMWKAILRRTGNADDPDYGGRGISVYPPWLEDPIAMFEYLLYEVGDRPSLATLDRIDNDGDYEPGNLRWASLSVQNANRRSWAVPVEWTLCLCQPRSHDDGDLDCPQWAAWRDCLLPD